MGFLALVIYSLMLFVRPHEWPIVNMEDLPIIRNMLLLTLAAFIIRQKKNLHAPHVKGIMLLWFAVVGSLIFTGYIGGAIFSAEQFLTTAVIPMLLINAFTDSRAKTYVLFWVVILASLIIVSDGHVQTRSENGLGWTGNPIFFHPNSGYRIRYNGLFSDPNDLGMLLVMTLPLILFFAARSGKFMKFIYRVMAGFILYGVYITGSRGTLLATTGMLALWFYRTYGIKRSMQVGVLCLPAVAVVFARFRAISAGDASSEGRLDAWYEGYQMLLGSPLFGVGNNLFMDHHFRQAHNSFVLAFAELGLFGVTIWTGLLVTTAWLLVQISQKKFVPAGVELTPYQQKEVDGEARIALALLYCATGYAVSAFFLSRTYVPILYFFIGLASANYCRATALFPKAPKLYQPNELVKLSCKVTMAGLVGTWLLVRLAL